MRKPAIYVLAVVAAAMVAGGLASAARANNAQPWVVTATTVLMMLVIMGGALGAFALKRRAERENRTNEDDSFERHMAVQVQARVFLDTLFLTVIVGCLFLIFPRQMNPGWVVLAIAVVSLIDFWVRFTVAKRVGSSTSS